MARSFYQRPPQASALALAAALVGLGASTGFAAAPASPAASTNAAAVIVIVGAPGEEDFGRSFVAWAGLWEKAAQRAGATYRGIGLTTNEPGTDRDRVQQALAAQATNSASELWLVLLGHGTFDGKEARFNLRGPDFTATEFADWLKPIRQPIACIDASSSSAPFLTKLAAPGRSIVTSTRSGHEVNFARFGQYLSEAIVDAGADLDKDGQTSLLEAFLIASRGVADFYSSEGRLATEHARLDDNGDGAGTPPDWFRGVRTVKSDKKGTPLDGLRAHQFHLIRNDEDKHLSPQARARRDQLEVDISKLRDAKKDLPEAEYYARLERLLLEMARLYESP